MKRMDLASVALLVGLAALPSVAGAKPDRPSFEQYLKQYLIGHYSPRGNHFFAYSIKDTVVQWLDPKPVPYQKRDPDTVDFRGYLPDRP